jgi:hypothetical protein
MKFGLDVQEGTALPGCWPRSMEQMRKMLNAFPLLAWQLIL